MADLPSRTERGFVRSIMSIGIGESGIRQYVIVFTDGRSFKTVDGGQVNYSVMNYSPIHPVKSEVILRLRLGRVYDICRPDWSRA